MSETNQTFTCPSCQKPFSNPNTLQLHKSRTLACRGALNTEHNQKKTYKCHICKKDNFRDSEKLNIHVPRCEKKKKKGQMKELVSMIPTDTDGKGEECEQEPPNQQELSGKEQQPYKRSKKHDVAETMAAGCFSTQCNSVEAYSTHSGSVVRGSVSEYDNTQPLGSLDLMNCHITHINQLSSQTEHPSTENKCAGKLQFSIIGKRKERQYQNVPSNVQHPPNLERLAAEKQKDEADRCIQTAIKELNKVKSTTEYRYLPLPEDRILCKMPKRGLALVLSSHPQYDPVCHNMGLPDYKTVKARHWQQLGHHPDVVLPFEQIIIDGYAKYVGAFLNTNPPAPYVYQEESAATRGIFTGKQYIPDYSEELDKLVKLDESEIDHIHLLLDTSKVLRANLKDRFKGLVHQLGEEHPVSLLCLPILCQAKIAVKNIRARTLHAIFDGRVAKPTHSVTINLGQYFTEQELTVLNCTKKELQFTVASYCYSHTAPAPTYKQLLQRREEDNELFLQIESICGSIALLLLAGVGTHARIITGCLAHQLLQKQCAFVDYSKGLKYMAETMTIVIHPRTKLTQSKYASLLQKEEELSIDKFIIADVKQDVNVALLMSADHVVAALGAPSASVMAKVNKWVVLAQNWELDEQFLIDIPAALPPPTPPVELNEEFLIDIPATLLPPTPQVELNEEVSSETAPLIRLALSDADKKQIIVKLRSVTSSDQHKLSFSTLPPPLNQKRTTLDAVVGTTKSDTPDSVCLTYSEITMESFGKILDALTEEKNEPYRLTKELSTFYDIGAGAGKCVTQAAFWVGCDAIGIEYAENKLKSSEQAVKDYEKTYGVDSLLRRVQFLQGDVTKMDSLNPATHIYCYNPTWKGKLMTALVDLLNRSTDWRVLVWAKNLDETRDYGLGNVRLVNQIRCKNVGKQSQTFYIYHREDHDIYE